MKIYIAGKITGDPDYKRKFHYAEKCLKAMGHSCMNPAVLNNYEDFSWNDYMDICQVMQSKCDAVFFLSDWNDSKGALQEFEFAKKLKQLIFYKLEDVPINC